MPNFSTLRPAIAGSWLWTFRHFVREYGYLTGKMTDEATEPLWDEVGIFSGVPGEGWLWTVCANVECVASDLSR